jgi:hypothetical protein
MEENEFWKIIESSGSPKNCTPNEQCDKIISQLSKKSKNDLISFANIHQDILKKAYTRSMLIACYILIKYISDDTFEDFRNWVILNGKDRFYKTIKEPDFIVSYITVEDPVEEVTGEALCFVCEEAWDGDIKELEENYIYPEHANIDDSFPSIEEREKSFPKLLSMFWDDEIIEI